MVLLSSQAVGTRPGTPSHAPLAELEEAVRSSAMEWTILHPGGFASNALAWVPMIKEMNAVHAPYGDVALPVVDPFDIAEVAAAIGRPLEFIEMTPEEARGQMSTFMPPAVVEEVLGRPARGFGEWARRFAAAYGA